MIAAGTCVALALTGCAFSRPSTSATPAPQAPTASATISTTTPSPTGTPSTTGTPSGATSASARPTAASTAASWKSRTQLPPTSTPYTVNGVPLVTRIHPVAKTYVPPWASRANGLSSETSAGVNALIAAAQKQGLTLRIRSGYRSWAAQKATYDNAVATHGVAVAQIQYAVAGASEHQTGLAADLTDAAGHRGTTFAATREAAFIAAHATDFGLIVRYPKGAENITSYIWEAWHVRYVGPEIAAHFAAHPGLTLEEYLGGV